MKMDENAVTNDTENHVGGDAAEGTANQGTANQGTANQGTANQGTPNSPVAAQPSDVTLAESVIDSATATDSATTSATTSTDSTAEPTASMDAMPSATLPIVASGKHGNANRLSHGRRSSPAVGLVRIELGSLPDSLQRVERQALAFRRLLENAVVEVHGQVSLPHALAINTAARWERHGNLCLRWLREHEATLTPEQRIGHSKAIADASTNRDKAVASLKLDRDAKENIFAVLYGERNGA